MSPFWRDAVAILETAAQSDAVETASDMAIVVERSGAMRIVPAEGWSTEGLRAEHGATAVYRIRRTTSGVHVDGRGLGVSCALQAGRMPQTTLVRGIVSF